MSETTQTTGATALLSEGVSRSVRRLRAMGAIIALLLVVLLLAAAGAMVFRALSPVAGTMTKALIAAGVAVAALALAVVVLETYSRRAKKAGAMESAVGAYSTGCVVAAVANLAAGAVTVGVIVVNGVGGGLWVPELLVIGLNVLGLVMAMPKMKHLRDLHYRPTLPGSRI